jgi:riboflavin biosynthesis pyrimidine reductase
VQQWWWGAASAEGFQSWSGQIDEARVFVAPILLGGGRTEPVDPGEDTLIETRFREW